MSVAIKFFVLFLLVESSTAKYIRDLNPFAIFPDEKENKSEIDYFSIFREIIRGWQREAHKKYPLWTSTNYMDRSLFLQGKVRDYVQLWGEWKNHKGYPYGDLRNKLQGDLWPTQYGPYCRDQLLEGKDLLTYLIYGLSAEADMV